MCRHSSYSNSTSYLAIPIVFTVENRLHAEILEKALALVALFHLVPDFLNQAAHFARAHAHFLRNLLIVELNALLSSKLAKEPFRQRHLGDGPHVLVDLFQNARRAGCHELRVVQFDEVLAAIVVAIFTERERRSILQRALLIEPDVCCFSGEVVRETGGLYRLHKGGVERVWGFLGLSKQQNECVLHEVTRVMPTRNLNQPTTIATPEVPAADQRMRLPLRVA